MLPFRRLLLALLAVTALAPVSSAQDDFARRAEALVEAYAEAGQFNGAILVADGDSVLYQRAMGYANMSWRVPNTTDTRFAIASITKQFTSALVHLLAEEGLVDLDATVRATLPSYPAAQGDRVTLLHLLTHTSGIPNFTRLPAWDNMLRDPIAPAAFLSVFSEQPLAFEPGTDFNYSNSNYFLLGVIVEHVTGKTFMQALYERLLAPLGLHDTGYDNRTSVVARQAQGYVPTAGGFAPEAYMDASFPYAAGMLYSTVDDLFRWIRALHNDEVFQNPETLSAMLTPGRGEQYGYARGISTIQKGFGSDTLRLVRHGGGIGGFFSEDRYFPEHDWTIVGLDNARGDIGGLADDLTRLLLGQEVDLPKRSLARVLRRMIDDEGIDDAVACYRAEPDAYRLDESELNALGYHYLAERETEVAIRVFEINADAFPNSWNAHDSLGEGLAAAGRTAEAIAAYEQSLALNPENAGGRDMLDRLR